MPKWWPFSKRADSIAMDALLIPAGAAVLLRTSEQLTQRQYENLKAALLASTAHTGVKFVVLTGAEWQVTAIEAETNQGQEVSHG